VSTFPILEVLTFVDDFPELVFPNTSMFVRLPDTGIDHRPRKRPRLLVIHVPRARRTWHTV